jgi:flagellar motor switch protein FliM
MPDQEVKDSVAAAPANEAAGPRPKQKTVANCDFRAAGRLSNETARALNAVNESFARRIAIALDAWLGTGVEVKPRGLDQRPVKEHVAALAPLTYVVPMTLSSAQTSMILEWDAKIVFALIEVLLGGTGAPGEDNRELSEIEEEIMQDVVALVARQIESAWHFPDLALSPGRRIKPVMVQQYCQANERLAIAKFEMELGPAKGFCQIVLPGAFMGVLIQQIKKDEPQKKGSVKYFPRPNVRERILDCDIDVAAELPGLRVAVRDLVGLQPGSVLKLRAPVRQPGMLTVGGQGIFEAIPVRNGSQKAAQLGRRTTAVNWERE